MPYRQPGMPFYERPIKLVRVRCPWCATPGVAPRASVEECRACGARFAVDAAIVTEPAPAPPRATPRAPWPEASPFTVLVLLTIAEVVVTVGLLLA